MQRLGRAFDIEETRVKAAEPLHMPRLGAMTTSKPIAANYNAFREFQCATS
jgi:hypothetical protein